MSDQAMKSPNEGYALRRLEGDAGRILLRGQDLSDLGTSMTETAIRLKELGDSSTYRSKATDKLVTTASEVESDLRAAATRYSMTGTAVTKYGQALADAQEWIHPRIDNIEAAENAYQAAKKAQAEAESERDRMRWPWEGDPTAAETQAANEAVSSAVGVVTDTKSTRDTLWNSFEAHFGAWETAYNEAVEDIENAMETAGNNDGFWEGFDEVLEIVGWAIIVLSAIGLLIGAPIVGAFGIALAILTAVVVLGRIIQFAFGQATLADVGFAALGLLPFGIGRVLSKGAPLLSPLISNARNVVTTSIRSQLPVPAAMPQVTGLMSAFRWVSTGVRNFKISVSPSIHWQYFRAPAIASRALPHPGVFVNPFRAMRLGPEGAQVEKFVQAMRNSRFSKELTDVIEEAAEALPSIWVQRANQALWVGDMWFGVQTTWLNFDKLFGLENVTVDNGPIR